MVWPWLVLQDGHIRRCRLLWHGLLVPAPRRLLSLTVDRCTLAGQRRVEIANLRRDVGDLGCNSVGRIHTGYERPPCRKAGAHM